MYHNWLQFPEKGHIYAELRLQNDKFLIIIVLVTTIANGLTPAITSVLTGRLFDLLANLTSREVPGSVFRELVRRSMSIMALGAACLPLTWMSISSWMWIGETQGFRLRNKLLVAYMTKSIEWYDQNVQYLGDLVQINRCIEEVRSSSAEASALVFQSMVAVASLIGVSFFYSWSLTLIILCSSPIIIVFAVILSRLINRYTELENTESSKTADLISFSMRAAQLLKTYGKQDQEIYEFIHSSKLCNNHFLKACLYVSLNSALLRFLTLCMFIQGFWFGTSMVRKGKLDIADVITCFHSCLMLGSTLSNALHQIVLLQKGDVAVKKIYNELPNDSHGDNHRYCSNPDFHDTSITFEKVSFSYPARPTDPVLQNISLHIESGETTFIVGKSGSGKSTLSNILLKFYSVTEGSVKVGNSDLSILDQRNLLEHITIVEQRCTLFNDTLKNNILMGIQRINDSNTGNSSNEKLLEAVQFARLGGMVDNLPDGVDTLLGSGGVSLSGGQQQRVALARAYVRNTDIVILDEAISALDIAQRVELMKNIKAWRKGRTTIILTHQIDDIEPSNFVYVMKSGCVVQQGKKCDLIRETRGLFLKLNVLQQTISEGNQKTTNYDDDTTTHTRYETDTLEYGAQFMMNKRKFREQQDEAHDTLVKRPSVVEKNPLDSNGRISSSDANLKSKIDTTELLSLKKILIIMFQTIRNKKLLMSGICSSILAGAANPIFSYTFSFLLNGIVPHSQNDSKYLLRWSFTVFGVAVADAIFNFLKSYILGYCSEYWIMDLRNETMELIVQKNLYWYSQVINQPTEISALLMNDLRDLRSLVSEFLSAMTTFIIVSLFGLIWALVSGWKLSLVCISMFPLIIIISGMYGSLLQILETDYKTSVAKLENCQGEIVSCIKTIKALQLESHFTAVFHAYQNKMRIIAKRRAIVTGMGIAIMNTLTMCIQAILYYYGLKLVLTEEYSSKQMFETFTLLLFTIMTCTSLVSQIPDIARGQRAASWIQRIVNEGSEWLERDLQKGRRAKIGNIRSNELVIIENLTFAYPSAPDVPVLRNLSLRLYDKTSVAIVGASGSGKSTIAQLLMKFYYVADSTVHIDGTDINDWSTAVLRAHVTVVEQKPLLIVGTLRENLVYGVADGSITDLDLFNVLKYVGLFNMLETLSDGLETTISSDLVSGGQSQRICIARALLRRSRILILDECTSALDAESAQKIRDIVQMGISDTLVVAITHSKPMMRCCDTVVVLQDGRVAEEGTYEELNIEGTIFSRLTVADED